MPGTAGEVGTVVFAQHLHGGQSTQTIEIANSPHSYVTSASMKEAAATSPAIVDSTSMLGTWCGNFVIEFSEASINFR
jgi:hypothetical protein